MSSKERFAAPGVFVSESVRYYSKVEKFKWFASLLRASELPNYISSPFDLRPLATFLASSCIYVAGHAFFFFRSMETFKAMSLSNVTLGNVTEQNRLLD